MAGRHPADEKTPGVIQAEIIMERSLHAGSFLLVEGDDDIRFFRTRVDDDRCHLVDCRGKANALGAMRLLDAQRQRGALAVVDDDFDTLLGKPCESANVVQTDAADLECVLLRSPALDRVLNEEADPSAVKALCAREGSVQEALLRRGLPFGQLRWLALRRGDDLHCDPLRPAHFVDPKTWELDRAALYKDAAQRGLSLTPTEIESAVAALPSADPWWICRGHDLIDLLVLALKSVLSRGGRSQPSRDALGKSLRLALHPTDFAATGLHAGIVDWQGRNPPYRVLSP